MVTGVEAVAAISIEREAAHRIGRAEVQRIAVVRILSRHLAAQQAAVLGDRLALRLQHRRVVAALHRDCQHMGGAVDAADGEMLGEALAGLQGLHGGILVVQSVNPGAIVLQTEMPVLG